MKRQPLRGAASARNLVVGCAIAWSACEEARLAALGTRGWRAATDALLGAEQELLTAVRAYVDEPVARSPLA